MLVTQLKKTVFAFHNKKIPFHKLKQLDDDDDDDDDAQEKRKAKHKK